MTVAFILTLVACIALWALLSKGAKKQDQKRRDAQAPPTKPVNPALFDEQEAFHIAGINMNMATARDCGTWKGYVYRDRENKYDKNAVAVFKGTQHVGYLHKEIAARYAQDIELSGGVLPAIVQIEQLRDEQDGHLFLNGMVQILWDGTE